MFPRRTSGMFAVDTIAVDIKKFQDELHKGLTGDAPKDRIVFLCKLEPAILYINSGKVRGQNRAQ